MRDVLPQRDRQRRAHRSALPRAAASGLRCRMLSLRPRGARPRARRADAPDFRVPKGAAPWRGYLHTCRGVVRYRHGRWLPGRRCSSRPCSSPWQRHRTRGRTGPTPRPIPCRVRLAGDPSHGRRLGPSALHRRNRSARPRHQAVGEADLALHAGHSSTLLLATRAGWQLDPNAVDVLIAGSVAYIGWRVLRGRPERWWPTAVTIFAFGLVHGLGLSTRLQGIDLPNGGALVIRIIAFKVGVEIGQLLALGVIIGAGFLALGHSPRPQTVRPELAAGLVAFGVLSARSRSMRPAKRPRKKTSSMRSDMASRSSSTQARFRSLNSVRSQAGPKTRLTRSSFRLSRMHRCSRHGSPAGGSPVPLSNSSHFRASTAASLGLALHDS